VTIASAAFLLFLVMDPLGSVPLFIAAMRTVERHRQIRVVARELLIAYAVLLVFLFGGQHLLRLMQISEPALAIAGGVILFLIALRMVFPSADRSMREDITGEPFVVPLAIPYVAGPAAMATVVLLMSGEPQRWPEWLVAMTIAWLATSVILLAGSSLSRFLGQKGLLAIERLMGMVLIALSVQMLLTGISTALRVGLPPG
jgi:multiple antibiotic resistance protein